MTDTMTEAREAELLRQIWTLDSVASVNAFRQSFRNQGERLTGNIIVALSKRADELRKAGLL